MRAANFVVISAIGDPTNPRTWSGTPKNLITSLTDIGCTARGLSLTPRRPVRAVLALLSLASGNGREYRRTRLGPMYSSLMLRMQADPDQGDTVFLHTGTATVPRGPKKEGVRHAIFMDTTFHLMSSYTIKSLSDAILRKYEQFEIDAIAAADHLFPVSECARQDLINHYSIPAERITAVGTGLGKIRPSDDDKDFSARTILFVAKERFEEKGGFLVLEGFRIAQKNDPRIRLTVVAPEAYRQPVESIPGATFKTALPWAELEALFNSASLFAMPALFEAWGLVYLEALACRTPVLGMNRSALPELTGYGECGFLLDDATPSSVASAFLDAFSDIDRLAEMGRNGQQRILSRYSWEKTASKIYNALFGSGYPCKTSE